MAVSSLRKTLRCCAVLAVLGGCAGAPAEVNYDRIQQSLHQAAAITDKAGDHTTAANHYRNLLNRQPTDRIALLGLARNLRYIGEAGAALDALEAGPKDFGNEEAFLVELGKLNIALGNAEKAIKALEAALKINGKKWETHAALGIGHDLMQSYPDAWEAYEKALALSPNNPAVLNNMAISAALDGRINLAISTLEEAAAAIRHNPQLRQNLALFYSIKGDLRKAKELAKMDLDEESVLNNLKIYRQFRVQSGKRETR